MQVSQTLDCNGLSEAPTVLRIKQALVGSDAGAKVGVMVGPNCDCDRVAGSLGVLASRILLVPAVA